MRRRQSETVESAEDYVPFVAKTPDYGEKRRATMDNQNENSAEDGIKIAGLGRKRSIESARLLTPTKSPQSTSPVSSPIEEKSNGDVMAEAHIKHRARLRSPWACSLLTLITTALSLILLATIGRSFLSRQLDPKGCQMSMMAPAYAKLDDFDTEYTRFASKYSLYLYREGGVDLDTRVKGIPVLFIPGNAGSYKQARPFAADAARYFNDVLQHDENAIKAGKRTLDFFLADFNEDITAFHGQTLLDQADYLNDAIPYILALYHNPHRSLRDPSLPDPTSIIILGHSMGGIVARTMLIRPNYLANSINTILTLSAPHARAPISFDSDIVTIYKDINDYWRQSYSEKWATKNPLWPVTLVSIAGGGLDTVVPSDYASLSSLVPETHGFTVFTSTIPNVWTGMDHLAITWCDQFRKTVVRAIYDVVDVRRPTQTRSRAERIQVFRKRFLTGMEPVVEKQLPAQEAKMLLTLEDQSTAVLPLNERLVLRSLGQTGKTEPYLMPIPVQGATEGRRFTLLTDQRLNSEGNIDAYFCSVQSHQHGQGTHVYTTNIDLSNGKPASRLVCKNAAADSIALPASYPESQYAFDDRPPFSYLQYDLASTTDYQFIAVVDKAAEARPGWLIAEFSSEAESTKKVDHPFPKLLTHGIRKTLEASRPLVNEMHIPVVHSSLLSYHLEIQQNCQAANELFSPLLRQYILEPYESKFFPNARSVNISLHGVSPYVPPPTPGVNTKDGLSLQIWSDPTCNSTMTVSLTIDLLGSAGKLYMRYRTVFAAFPLLVVALVLRKQFKVYNSTGIFISFTEAMDRCIRTSLPLLFVALSFLALSFSRAGNRNLGEDLLASPANGSETIAAFTRNELLLGSHDPFFWFLVPLFGLISVGVCIALNYATLALTYIFTGVYSKVRSQPLRNEDGRRTSTAVAVTSPLQRVVTTGILLLMVATVIPYQFAYLVLCIVQLATCVRALRLSWETHAASSSSFYNYTHSLLVLMLWVLPINIPVLVVWIHNLAVHWLTPFSSHHNIASIMPYILLVETLSTGHMVPRIPGRLGFGLVTNVLLFGIALYAAVYGVTYAYCLHRLVNGLCAWLVIVHFVGEQPSTASANGSNVNGASRNRGRLGIFVAGLLDQVFAFLGRKGGGRKKRP